MQIQRQHINIRQQLAPWLTALLLVTFTTFPATTYAEEVPTGPAPVTTTTETQPSTTEAQPTTTETQPSTTEAQPTTGPQQPTGAEATSYTYNEATGLWENDKYTWNPVTHQTSPKTAPDYSYNPSTGMWDTTEWIYDAPSGAYVPNVISTTAPPAGVAETDALQAATDAVGSTESTADAGGDTAGAARGASPTVSQLLSTANDPEINSTSKSSGVFDLFYNALISNSISSSSVTGDALVSMNTLAGNALSGDASAIATILNLLQSTWNLGAAGNLITTFTQNLFGSILGDLWLQPGDAADVSATTANDLTINSTQNAMIDNTITLEATSGDATVSTNTQAGNATTGSATAIANIINAINSSIVSGSSFIGMLNIFGSLDGDILLPEEFLGTLLAANTLGSLDTSTISNTEVLADFTNNASTTNNVTAAATSGDAAVTQNTSAGNATTGDAATNVTVLNLTGRQVIGKNALLVFVNVLGTWVGMIVDAPSGATSAALGGGITEDNSLAITAESNQTINNDVNVRATSGDALVTKNSTAGNATSGDASAAVNILNMNANQFALSDWFGILFINVFGSWNGSFGLDTIAGSLPPAALAAVQANTTPPSTPSIPQNAIRAFVFTPHEDGTYTLDKSDQGAAALAEAGVLVDDESSDTATVLAAQDTGGRGTTATESPLVAAAQMERDWTLAILTTTLGVSLLGAERIASRRSAR